MLNVFLFQWTLITKQKISDETDDDNMLILYYYIHTYIQFLVEPVMLSVSPPVKPNFCDDLRR